VRKINGIAIMITVVDPYSSKCYFSIIGRISTEFPLVIKLPEMDSVKFEKEHSKGTHAQIEMKADE
jgi:hypothetical protein